MAHPAALTPPLTGYQTTFIFLGWFSMTFFFLVLFLFITFTIGKSGSGCGSEARFGGLAGGSPFLLSFQPQCFLRWTFTTTSSGLLLCRRFRASCSRIFLSSFKCTSSSMRSRCVLAPLLGCFENAKEGKERPQLSPTFHLFATDFSRLVRHYVSTWHR